MHKLFVVPNDPLIAYVKKGEIKPRYWNPNNIFSEVHILDFTEESVDIKDVQTLAGDAKLYIHEIKPRSFFRLPFLIGKVSGIVKNVSPSVLRIHAYRHIGVLAIYAAKKLKIPVVVSVHGDSDEIRKFNTSIKFKLAKYFEKYSFVNSNIVFCTTDAMQPYVKRYKAKKIETIYNKVYLNQFRPKSNYELKENNRLNVLSIMRLEIPNKDPLTLLKGVKLAEFVKLKLVGSGPDEKTVRNSIDELGLSDRVELIKSVPHNSIHQLYENADIFAMSTGFEGFCIPILEAMASALPIVSSNTVPIPEVLGGTGILIERKPEEYARVFNEFFTDVKKREMYGSLARIRAELLEGNSMEKKESEIFLKLFSGNK